MTLAEVTALLGPPAGATAFLENDFHVRVEEYRWGARDVTVTVRFIYGNAAGDTPESGSSPATVRAFEELVRQAAQGEVLHNDDTTVKILELMGERRQQALADAEGEGDDIKKARLRFHQDAATCSKRWPWSIAMMPSRRSAISRLRRGCVFIKKQASRRWSNCTIG
jgi:hypothetical protein